MAQTTENSDQKGIPNTELSTDSNISANVCDRPSRTSEEPEFNRVAPENPDPSVSEMTKGEKDASDEKEGNEKAETDKTSDETPKLPRTRIGRPNKDDKKDIIDQADWQTMVPKKDPKSKFVMAVNEGDDGREQVTLYSPYIQKVFRAVIRYLF